MVDMTDTILKNNLSISK